MSERPLPPLPSWPELVSAVEDVVDSIEGRERWSAPPDSGLLPALRCLLAHMKAFPTAAERMAAIHYQSESCLAVYDCTGNDGPGVAVDELLDPMNYVEPNQERPPARETGGEVRPTGHNTPSPPGAVHSKEPWCSTPYNGDMVSFTAQITFGDGEGCVAMFGGDSEAQARANADRSIACVNFCSEMTTSYLVANGPRRKPITPIEIQTAARERACWNALAGVPNPEKLMIAVRKAVDNYVRSQESMTGPFIFPGIDEIAAALKEDS